MSTPRKMIGANITRIKKITHKYRGIMKPEHRREVADAHARVFRDRGMHVADGYQFHGTNVEGGK